MTKKCSKCKIVKNRIEFYKKSSEKDGLQPYCVDCQDLYRYERTLKSKTNKISKLNKDFKLIIDKLTDDNQLLVSELESLKNELNDIKQKYHKTLEFNIEKEYFSWTS